MGDGDFDCRGAKDGDEFRALVVSSLVALAVAMIVCWIADWLFL